jgi:DNA polymerase III delta prime subunit
MNTFEELFPQDLYHSYVVEGEPNTTAGELLKFLEVRGIAERQSPDVLYQVYESFTMDDSSQIREWHSQLGIGKNKRVCIIATKFINREAEQTLLKIIEEPALNTHFFIIVPDSGALLGTILSRVHIIKTEISNRSDVIDLKKIVSEFIKSNPGERIKKVAVIIDENKDKENSGQLRYYATSFVNEVESIYHQKFTKDKNNAQIKFALTELQKSREYLSTPGASVKMILEHLALVI